MRWKKLFHKQNARHYAWPTGWDTAEQIAEQLECSPERVREHLAPSIRAGEVEVKVHTVWDEETGRKVQKTGFRMVSRNASNAEKATKESVSTIKAPVKAPVKDTKASARWPFYDGARITRMGSPTIGTVKGHKIVWDSGVITIPSAHSTKKKLRLA